jgi:hypothetical protein
MRWLAAAVWLSLAACGPKHAVLSNEGGVSVPDAGSPRAPVTCGAATCGVDEYCEERCTCCGMRVPDPSEASGTAVCKPLPDSCKNGGDGPECQQRTVAIPCA